MSHEHDDYAVEPIRGLPQVPPEGEHILWQGGPDWRALARDVFHIRGVAVYLILLMAWRGAVHWNADHNAMAAIVTALALLPIALGGLGLLALLAWLSARTSVYTITNRRVVMRIGMALPMAINIPFRVIGVAGLHVGARDTGDIPLTLIDSKRMAYSNLWPHVRPWRLANPEPMLRGIPDASRVANLLGNAMAEILPQSTVVAADARPADAKSPKTISYPAPQSGAAAGQPA